MRVFANSKSWAATRTPGDPCFFPQKTGGQCRQDSVIPIAPLLRSQRSELGDIAAQHSPPTREIPGEEQFVSVSYPLFPSVNPVGVLTSREYHAGFELQNRAGTNRRSYDAH